MSIKYTIRKHDYNNVVYKVLLYMELLRYDIMDYSVILPTIIYIIFKSFQDNISFYVISIYFGN